MAPTPAMGTVEHQDRPQDRQQHLRGGDGLRGGPDPTGPAAIAERDDPGGGGPAARRGPHSNTGTPAPAPHGGTKAPSHGRDGVREERGTARPLGAAVQRTVQSDQQRAQVLQHRHWWAASGGHGGPPQAAHGDVSINTGCPASQRAATGGKAAAADIAPQPAQEDTFPGPTSDNRRPPGTRAARAGKIRPLSDKQVITQRSRGSSVVPPIDQPPSSL